MTPTDPSASEPASAPPSLGAAFYKAHGLGNDYLVFAAGSDWRATEEAIRAVCDRWRGPGSDGIVCHLGEEDGAGGGASEQVDDAGAPRRPVHLLRMFNPDGSEFERSGNGLRVLSAYLRAEDRVEDGLPFRVAVGGDVIEMEVLGRDEDGALDIRVGMGSARIGLDAVAGDPETAVPAPDAVGSEGVDPPAGLFTLPHPALGDVPFTPVSVGNPHCVHFVGEAGGGNEDERGDELLQAVGPFLCAHPAFANGVNVQVARAMGPSTLRIWIWERGVGETSASGTSACAAAVAAVRRGLMEPGEIGVRMDGGRMRVTVTSELEVVLRGPVEEVYRGELEPAFLDRLRS